MPQTQHYNIWRLTIGLLASLGLIVLFLFQRWDFASSLGVTIENQKFVINRSIRFILNDTFTITIIYALFVERKYVLFAMIVQAFGFVFLLIPYFILVLHWPHYNGPLLSFLHRISVNPLLLLLLIPAFYYQKNVNRFSDRD